MQITKELRKILISYSTINQQILFKPGNFLSTVSQTMTIKSIAAIDTEVPIEFALSNLAEFLNITALLSPNHDISFTDYQMIIKDGNTNLKYTLADSDTIYASDYEEAEYSDVIAQFSLNTDVLNDIMKASSILKSNKIMISGKADKNITITAGDLLTKGASRYNKIMDDIDQLPTEDFMRPISLENFKIINGDYKVVIPSEPFIELSSDTMKYWIVETELSHF